MSRTKKAIIVLISLMIGGILGEVLLRIAIPKEERVEHDPRTIHPELGHIMEPESIPGIDDQGWLNPIALERAEIVALGDSHASGTFKDGEYLNWPSFLADELGVSVYNMGLGGYGPVQYSYLLDEALEFAPDILVVGFYTGNDLWDAYNMVYHNDAWVHLRSPDFIDDAPLDALNRVEIRFKGLRDFLSKHSILYEFLGDQTLILREYLGLSKPRTIGTNDWKIDDPDVSLRFNDEDIDTIFWSGSRVRGIDQNSKNIKEGMRITKRILRDINDRTSKTGVKLVVVFIPSKESAYGTVVGELGDDNLHFRNILISEEWAKEELMRTCDELFIACHDILPALQTQLEARVRLYKENFDDHPLEMGYRVYGKSIGEFLSEKNILP